jgi:hypothetical protein
VLLEFQVIAPLSCACAQPWKTGCDCFCRRKLTRWSVGWSQVWALSVCRCVVPLHDCNPVPLVSMYTEQQTRGNCDWNGGKLAAVSSSELRPTMGIGIGFLASSMLLQVNNYRALLLEFVIKSDTSGPGMARWRRQEESELRTLIISRKWVFGVWPIIHSSIADSVPATHLGLTFYSRMFSCYPLGLTLGSTLVLPATH